MDGLLDENILNILQRIDLPDRLSFAQVNSRFNQIASTQYLWRNVALTITETQLLLCVGSRHPPTPISYINVYAKHFGKFAHFLDLTINIPFGYDESTHARVEQIVNALNMVDLLTLTLRFPDFCNKYNFGAFFNAIKSSLRKFEIITRFPNVSLYFVRELCKTSPNVLGELSLMHDEQDLIRPPTAWLSSLMLESIEQDSKKICCTQEDADELCDNIKSCELLGKFETNILINSLFEAFAKMIGLRTFGIVLVVNEASVLDGPCSEEYAKTVQVCKNLEVHLRLTTFEAAAISILRKLPTALPVKTLELKLTTAQNLLEVSAFIRVVVEKFPETLKLIYLGVDERTASVREDIVNWVRKNYPQLIISA